MVVDLAAWRAPGRHDGRPAKEQNHLVPAFGKAMILGKISWRDLGPKAKSIYLLLGIIYWTREGKGEHS
jgi:hypothetical protein